MAHEIKVTPFFLFIIMSFWLSDAKGKAKGLSICAASYLLCFDLLMHWIFSCEPVLQTLCGCVFFTMFSIANLTEVTFRKMLLHTASFWATSNLSALGFAKEEKLVSDVRTNINTSHERSRINRGQHNKCNKCSTGKRKWKNGNVQWIPSIFQTMG